MIVFFECSDALIIWYLFFGSSYVQSLQNKYIFINKYLLIYGLPVIFSKSSCFTHLTSNEQFINVYYISGRHQRDVKTQNSLKTKSRPISLEFRRKELDLLMITYLHDLWCVSHGELVPHSLIKVSLGAFFLCSVVVFLDFGRFVMFSHSIVFDLWL